MRGQGMGRQRGKGRASAGRRITDTLVCRCTRCGYKQAHTPGVPCRDAICPHCGVPLLKMDAAGQIITQNREYHQGNIQNASSGTGNNKKSEPRNEERYAGGDKQPQPDIPLIDTSKCTGCGTCVDACRRDAIKLVNGVAQIIPELCINCGLCVRKCPEGAIS